MERKSSLVIGPRTKQDVLKGKVIRKHDDGGDMFEDYWTDSDGESSTLSKKSDASIKWPDVEPSNFVKTSNFSQKNSHLSLKAVETTDVSNDDADEVASINKEMSAEDLTINLGVNDNNLGKRIIARLSEVPPVLIQEVNDASLSHTYNKSDVRKFDSKISLKLSKKSISRSTKKDAKIKEIQLQYDKYDEKIMQMIHMNDSENQRISIASEKDMSLTQQSSLLEQNSSEKENFFEESQNRNQSSCESNRKNIKSHNLNVDDSDDISIYQKKIKVNANNQENDFKHLKSTTEKTVIRSSSQLKNKPSKKNIPGKSGDDSIDSHSDLSYSDSISEPDTNAFEAQANKQTAVSDNYLNTSQDSPRNATNDVSDSPSKNTRKQKKDKSAPEGNLRKEDSPKDVINDVSDSPSKNTRQQKKDKSVPDGNVLPNQDPSSTLVLEKSLPCSPKHNLCSKNKSLHRNNEICSLKTGAKVKSSYNSNVVNASESALDVDSNTSEACMIEKQKPVTDKKSYFTSDEKNLSTSDLDDSPQLQATKQQKAWSVPEENDLSNVSVIPYKNSLNDASEINKKDVSTKLRVIKNNKSRQKMASDKESRLVSDEDIVETANTDNSPELQSTKRQKTIVNKRNISIPEGNDLSKASVSSSDNSLYDVSEIQAKKATKKYRIIKKKKRQKMATDKESRLVSDEDIVETANTDNSPQLQSTKRQKTFVNKRNRPIPEGNDLSNASVSSSDNSLYDVSEIQEKKSSQKMETKKESGLMPDEDIVVDHDSLYEVESPMRKKSSAPKACHLRFSEKSVDNISENVKKTKKNLNNFENNKSRQRNKEIEIMVREEIIETSKTHNSPKLQSIKNKKKKQKLKTIMNKRNSSISEENDLFNASMNSSNNYPHNVSEIQAKTSNKKTLKAKRSSVSKDDDHANKKTATNKGSHFTVEEEIIETLNRDSNDISEQQASKKQKTKNSIAKENKIPEKFANNVSEANFSKTKIKRKKNYKSGHLFENDAEDQGPAKTKVAKKSKLPKSNFDIVKEAPNAVRKSTRQRFAPFAHWRNERLLYRFENGKPETIGVDNGTKEDNFVQERIHKKMNEKQSKLKKKISMPKKANILDVFENKKKSVHLQKKFPLVPWDKSTREKEKPIDPEHEFLIKRMIDTKRNCFGFIQIDVGKQKPMQFMPEEDLQLTLVEGRVEIHVQKEIYTLEKKDMFIVPRSSAYSIKNVGRMKALLSYAVGKFKFLENE